MADPNYIVVRLVPESPVDGATFATYLDGLSLQVLDANTSQPRSDLAYSSPLILLQWPGVGGYLAAVSAPTAEPTPYGSGNYGKELKFTSTDGIAVGDYVYSSDQTTIKPSAGLTVVSVTAATSTTPGVVTLSDKLTDYVPAGTVVSFLGQPPSSDPTTAPAFSFPLSTNAAATSVDGDLVELHFADTSGVTIGMGVSGSFIAAGTTVAEVTQKAVVLSQALSGTPPTVTSVTFTLGPPYAYFSATPLSGTPAAHPTSLKFTTNTTGGIAVGMTLKPSAGLIAPGTKVTSVTATTVKLSKKLLGPLPSGHSVTFTFPLSIGIAQHLEPQVSWNLITGLNFALIPASVATAVIMLNPTPPLPDYLDIKISATRGTERIPFTQTFYNVRVSTGKPPDTPFDIQSISIADTGLYLTLPPPPGLNLISVAIPGDGSAPRFEELYQAIQTALTNDPVLGASFTSLSSSPAWCTRIAYDIVWSDQNNLPLPPDPLEMLYTNPPNPGGGGSITNSSGGSNNYEQDRQKFEGTLSSFYSTRNANAERLTKFVAAASAAVACEAASLDATAALLEFPVDPSATYAAAVDSELLLQGLGLDGEGEVSFGVPAAFFYALGAHLDKSTSASRRFQMATGDAIERLLQEFATAESLGVIDDSADFTDASLGLPSITAFQAARRLVALGISAASTSPSVTLLAGTPLAALVNDWLSVADAGVIQSPPLTYQNTDFNIWTQQLATADPQGYLELDLDALTRGYIIPPFAASPTSAAATGATTLTFTAGAGIGAGMPVAGPYVAPGTTVQKVEPASATTVSATLSAAILGPVSPSSTLVFNYVIPPVTADTTADCQPGSAQLTFGGTTGISVGMLAFSPGIPAGTVVQSLTATTVTLSTAVTADVPSGSAVMFAIAPQSLMPSAAATTTADCLAGTTLTFADTTGISAGTSVTGPGIGPGTAVQSLTTTTVTLSNGVMTDVPSGTVVTFQQDPGSNIPAVQATINQDCAAGTTLTFADTTGISAGLSVAGPGIATGTTVLGVTATTVTLSTGVAADVPASTAITFLWDAGPALPSIQLTTTQDCPTGDQLTFAETTGITVGMSVFADNVTAGTTVGSVAATTVTLSGSVTADVPMGSVVTFAIVPSTLADQIAAWLPSTTSPPASPPVVATLKQTTAAQWTTFFTVVGSPQWLPPFTQPVAPGVAASQGTQKPGYTALRIRSFIRAVQQFFTVSSVATSAQLPPADAPPTFELPAFDPIGQADADLASFQFGNPLSGSSLDAAAQTVFGTDPAAQAWLEQAMTAINDLWTIASAVQAPKITPYTLPNPVSFSFSVMEALYARGFRNAQDITRLSAADFQQALTGTVAYDFATSGAKSLYATAQSLAPNSPGSDQDEGTFHPVNPDGSLVNCLPPPCLSPTSPIAYLQEMLTVSALSTCDTLVAAPVLLTTTADAESGSAELTFASTAGVLSGMLVSGTGVADGTTVTTTTPTTVTLSGSLTATVPTGTSVAFSAPTLGWAVSQRRGPVGDLDASCANLQTPLPLIDIVNERLEYLAAAAQPAAGPVYNTSGDALAGHELCSDQPCPDEDKPDEDEEDRCHDPADLLGALPEYSTPATPVEVNATTDRLAFGTLKTDTSSCLLPYSQPLDVSRSYLHQLGSSRFDEMRAFRKCITEFVLDPAYEPTGFQDWLWRYPVRIDTAIEYLGISPEEYRLVFEGAMAPPCAPADDAASAAAQPDVTSDPAGQPEPVLAQNLLGLPAFLGRTCLSYCEFYDLWLSGYVPFRNGADRKDGAFPLCEPCCLDDLWLEFPGDQQEQDLAKLDVFIRLWRRLSESCSGYSFARLRDICDVLKLYSGGAVNPDFIRQLAAFQMLRDHFELELDDDDRQVAANAVDADRTHLLALWVGPAAATWTWAVRQLVTQAERHAHGRYGCEQRPPEFRTQLTAALEQLSQLAGFGPESTADSWQALPTHTLRFAEVLSKIWASGFSVGELIFLFTAHEHLDGDDPFALQEHNEAVESPLGLPDDTRTHALWRLRHEMLEATVGPEEAREWPWRRIDAALQAEFGFEPADVLDLGQHFFPGVLAEAGHHVSPAATRFRSALPASKTSPARWNTPPDGPLRYDQGAHELSAAVPLADRAVLDKLMSVDLNGYEQAAVQDVFFQPGALLATFALLFSDFATAQRRLIEESDEAERFGFFRHQVLLCRRRRAIIARHLAGHVRAVTGGEGEDPQAEAELILRTMYADENLAKASWEQDSGALPALTWPAPGASGLAALLGLVGTGLTVEYRPAGGTIAWRDVSGPLSAFGAERNRENCPVPTVLPSLGTELSAEQLEVVSVRNGFLMDDASGAWLGGAQGFTATWSGALLVTGEGSYEFWAGAPTPDEERPDLEAAERCRWRVVLQRGHRSTVILSHHWEGEEERRSAALPLRRGAYELTAEFVQPLPDFDDDESARRQRTGFQVKYSGPDSGSRRIEIPHSRLFAVLKDTSLGEGIPDLSPGAAAYLSGLYRSSLRDIRRTYQRAFKALLFSHRLALSAHRQPHGTSELGYLLSQPGRFAGEGYYRSGTGFTQHAAHFIFDFLPLRDSYYPPSADARAAPKPRRSQAMFDWWERLFDYTQARADVRRRCGRQLWHLFAEAQEKQPADAGPLLRHLGADARHWPLELRYFQGQHTAVYPVNSNDLCDDRWTLRAWHADRWLEALGRSFTVQDISVARPDLWACDDPGAKVFAETETGNANLTAFVADGCLEADAPRRYHDLRRLNDGLRERGRTALLAYLCTTNRVALPWQQGAFAMAPSDLSDLLLVDVEAGACERASRIDEAISAVQSFVRRSRLGLEPGWPVTREFTRLWDSRFATYRTWERCKLRELYRENWIEWDELSKARRIEAFRFLEERLRTSALTVAAPGGLDWWAADGTLGSPPELIQRQVPSVLHPLSPPPQSATREGLGTLGRPEYPSQPSWLAAVPLPSGTGTGGGTGNQPAGGTTSQDPNRPPAESVRSLAAAAESAGDTPESLPLWMEAAMKLGTQFVRVAAAGVPRAAARFAAHEAEPDRPCCQECGRDHPVHLDEYYFWLIDTQFYTYTDNTDAQNNGDASFTGSYQFGFQDSYYDQFQQQSAEWQDEDQVPSLLAKWHPSPAVRLAWCRVHNGEFGQLRTSPEFVALADAPPDLVFLGRAGDSLYFEVSPSAPAPAGYGADTSPPGFRYDLPADHAVALPRALKPPAPETPSPYPGGLLAYPFFAYHDPGASLFPRSWFATSVTVAEALRGRCHFELALGWYKRAYSPLDRDCTWVHCQEQDKGQHQVPRQGACCDSTKITEEAARHRLVLLHYCDTLIEWGDALMRRRRSPEAFAQARLLYDTAARITGPRPRTVAIPQPQEVQSVTDFTPAPAPLNPRLMDLYDRICDRLALIHHCLNGRRIRAGQLGPDLPYFGDDPLRHGWRAIGQACADEDEWCLRPSPYRFLFQVQKATEIAGRVRELGAALLSALEKGDSEYLADLHAQHEREMLELGITIRQDQWRDADWQVQALQQTKDVNQANLLYYASLYQGGLLNDEIQNLALSTNAIQTRTGTIVTEVMGELMSIIPDFFVGAMSTFSQVPIGTKLAGLFQTIGKVMQTIAEIESAGAAIDMTQAGWQRRSAEWFHQMQVLPIEIHQAELQILGAQRRRDQAMAELNNQQRQVEHSAEIQACLRDEFTSTELHLWLQSQTAGLHARMYELALQSAREAQRAFNFERGHTTRQFIPEESWDSLHQGLTAGDRLELALRRMEKAYLDENHREYELTKHISLRQSFPAAYLRLRTTGSCQIEIPEWMFDLDYPSHYLRRIKSVSLIVPWVGGPYLGLHCRLTLLSSMTRIDPTLRPAAHGCCCGDLDRHEHEHERCDCRHECGRGDRAQCGGYEPCADDPRIVREYAARESIATSSGQNDSGLFELSFRDERYLPFEFQGAVSRWRLELPPDNNYFDLDTVSDVVLRLSYTAREGGDELRKAAALAARGRLPGDGLRLFDVRHDFPDVWPAFRERDRDDDHDDDRRGRHRRLRLGFTRGMFPFVPGRRVRGIDRLVLAFEAPGAAPGRHHLVRFRRDDDDDSVAAIRCVADGSWPGFFCGVLDLDDDPLGPLRDDRPVACTLEFPADAGEVCGVFVIAAYSAECWPRCGAPEPCECHKRPGA